MRYEVIAALDGNIYHDDVEAADQEEAESKARAQLAEAWGLTLTLNRYRAEDDEEGFDCELDGFSVDPVAPCNTAMTDAERVDRALELLREARELIKAAGNKRTLARIRLAISSCKGARRIQASRRVRADMGAAR
jgi:hypothetical protein